MNHFECALKSLIEDPTYRQAVIDDWSRLTDDFGELNPQELLLLMQVWNATGNERAPELTINMCHCCCCSA
jgi:hypothetical protein